MRRLALVEDGALAVGRDLVDDALVAGAGVQRSRPVELASAQMYLSSGIEERRGVPLRRPCRSARRATCRRTGRRWARAPARAPRARSRRRTRATLPCDRSADLAFVAGAEIQRPSGAEHDRQRTATRSRTTSVGAGPSSSWPCWSIDRFLTSPFRKSAWVATCQKRAAAANTPRRPDQHDGTQEQAAGDGIVWTWETGRRGGNGASVPVERDASSVRAPLTAWSVGELPLAERGAAGAA